MPKKKPLFNLYYVKIPSIVNEKLMGKRFVRPKDDTSTYYVDDSGNVYAIEDDYHGGNYLQMQYHLTAKPT